MGNASARPDVGIMRDGDQRALDTCMICGKRLSDYDEVQQHYRIDHQHKRK